MADEVRNGMPATRIDAADWRKSSRSGAVGNCVELCWPARDVVAIRNSRDPRGPVLVYPRTRLAGFLAGLRADGGAGAGLAGEQA
ncbi:hypothetical protein BU204_21920 [Actinophytocola xanthii]|uniref:DUF397 domain-containing protein n=2 Tax=Actinophytocola xanthii TaxID=1912961 RepID=A0A1Q8CM73_9PSEU|nr:DUF397 domain-containing protein [Actinophytocola xanthii]OLF15454.1 hypothetical protein BU204_21920 [Actinophytocola xanthii]